MLIKKKSVTDRDIHAIIQGTEHEQNAIYQVDTLQLQFVSNGLQSAVVVIKDKNGNIYQDSSIGTGSIVAIYNAVDRIFKHKSELIDYRIDSVTEGTDAQAEVHVSLTIEGPLMVLVLIMMCYMPLHKAYVEAHAKYASEINKKEEVITNDL